MPKPKKRIYDRNLRKMFWPGDREFNARVARLCVLYEDLRIEYHGSRMLKPIKQLDRLSKMYRQFYFLRRSLVTLIEFQGALSQINRGRWKKWIERHQDPVMRKSWAMSIRYFNENSKRWEALRGDVGGHYPEAAAKFAVDHLTSNATRDSGAGQSYSADAQLSPRICCPWRPSLQPGTIRCFMGPPGTTRPEVFGMRIVPD